MEWMILPLKRYFDFSGRSRRKEYWLFTLFLIVCSIAIGFLEEMLGLAPDDGRAWSSGGLISSGFSIATLIPSISVGVRRLHDTDRSGWWMLLPLLTMTAGAVIGGLLFGGFSGDTTGLAGLGGLVGGLIFGVVVGGLVLLVFYCIDGTQGPNRFGDDPKDPVLHNVAEVFR